MSRITMLFIKNLKVKIIIPTLMLAMVGVAIGTLPTYAATGEASGQVADICDASGNPTGCTPASPTQQDACAGLKELNGSTAKDCTNLGSQGKGFSDIIKTAVEVLSWVVGVVSIIMVLVSGLKYMTSGGDSSKVSSAKSTLIYALIGVAIAILAQLLVRVAITTAGNSTPGSCKYKTSLAANDAACKPPSP